MNFKNSQGVLLTKGLFEGETQIYNLKNEDTKVPSLYKLYMDCEDLTEWEFAQAHLDSFEHWEMICDCNWFKPIVERWRRELALKLKAKALRRLMIEAESDTKNSFQANRFIIEKGWAGEETKGATKRGRPSKDEIRKATVAIVQSNNRVDEDFERLFN